jgi:hypothetical protein
VECAESVLSAVDLGTRLKDQENAIVIVSGFKIYAVVMDALLFSFYLQKQEIKMLRQNSLVTLTQEASVYHTAPFKKGHPYLYFGEIPNMKGHGIFIDMRTTKMYTGWHIDMFREMTEEEC